MQPETRYAKAGDLHIAYQVVGEGPIDLVFPPIWYSHIDAAWDFPEYAHFLNRLASFSRLIVFDQRGTGMSDPIPLADPPTLEERIDEFRAVMDAAGCKKAALLGSGGGGALSALFAAMHPERTTALVLLNTTARPTRAPDYPMGLPPERIEEVCRDLRDTWGRDERLPAGYDDATRKQIARYQRMAMSPTTAMAIHRMNLRVDIRDVLPTIRVPTLVLHHRGNMVLKATHGRYLADHIEGARFLVLEGDPGDHHFGWRRTSYELDEIEEFLTGVRPHAELRRVLATVLFTDVVSSTKSAWNLGDRSWRDLLEAHGVAIRRQLDRFQGLAIRVAGEESLSRFDGPARAIRCAIAIRESLRPLGLEVRAGLHTGEIELLDDDVGGVAVHIGARVSAMAGPGEVLVSSTVKDLVVGSGIEFEDRGTHQLKGVPDEWRIYAVRT